MNFAYKNELTSREANKIITLIKSGMKVDEAKKKYKKYGTTVIGVTFKRSEMEKLQEKYKISKNRIVTKLLKNEISETIELKY